MAGYCGWSMSNNALDCYDNNIRPKSTWTRSELLDEIKETYGEEIRDRAKKHTLGFLRDCFLSYDSWHHTGKHYRCTDFYRFDDGIKSDELENILNEVEVKEEKDIPVPFPVKADWLEWSGSRNHPKSHEVKGFGRIVGNVFICTDGTRKRIDGKYFTFKALDEKEAKAIFKQTYRLRTSHRYNRWLATGKIN